MSDPERTPDVDRGPSRPLTERAARMAARRALTDRRGRFHDRLAAVRAVEARRQRRHRRLELAVVAAVALGLPLVGGWATTLLVDVPVGTGVAAGVVVAVVVLAGRRLARRHAESRGARAWDWTRRRYVTHGDPSRRAQDLTGAPDRRPGRGRRG